MPTVKLNRKTFETLVGKKLPIEKLKDRISMLGTDLEDVTDKEIVVEIFPNRPDLLSEQGFARAFSSFIGIKTGLRKYKTKKSGYQVIVDKNVTMRPYTACAIVKNITFNDERIREIMQIQEKLAKSHGRDRAKSAYGLYPSKGINFPVHYIAKDPKKVKFKPLGFKREMRADDIEELHPKAKEYTWITKDWKKYPFFIDNKKNIMCMLPYTNSEDTGKIDNTTKEVFIECTGNNFENVKVALNIFVTLLADMGGEIYSIDIKYPTKTITTPNLSPTKWSIDINYVNKILGLNLKDKEIKILLEKMGFGYEKGKVLVPAYRADIMHQIDFVEDIAIAYGYENFVPEIPNVATIGKEDDFEVFKRKVSEILVGLQLLECETYNLTNKEIQNTKMNTSLPLIPLANSVSQEYNVLRAWVLPNMLQILEENKHHDYPQNLFTIGRVFKKNIENDRLAIVLCDSNANFTKIKQVLDYLMRMLDIKYKVKSTKHSSFIEGRTGRVTANGKEVAYIGEINPKVLNNFGLEFPVAALEINLSELF